VFVHCQLKACLLWICDKKWSFFGCFIV